jgi:hypothetical protein
MSCDLKETEVPGPHYTGSVFDVLNDGWDLLIGHPPCTYLSYAGIAHWNAPGRCEKRLKALIFFRKLYEAPIPRICLENPKGCASPTIAKYSQEIQPYFFGDRHLKTTWLWLVNLPLLIHVEKENDLFEQKTHTERPEPLRIDSTGKKEYFTVAMSGKDRQTERSRTFSGIAEAMAEQWGKLNNTRSAR